MSDAVDMFMARSQHYRRLREFMGGQHVEVLREARRSLVRMCALVTEQTMVAVVPSFLPGQGAAVVTPADLEDADWVVAVGSDGETVRWVTGRYEELVRLWKEGPESFYDWVMGLATLPEGNDPARDEDTDDDAADVDIDIADDAADADGTDDTYSAGDTIEVTVADTAADDVPAANIPDDGETRLPAASDEAVVDAKVALTACGYVVSPASVPDYMGECAFVAWKGDCMTLVSVTESDDAAARKAAIAADLEAFLNRSERSRDDVAAVVVTSVSGRTSLSDATAPDVDGTAGR